MSHSKAKREAKARQAATGESYTRARRIASGQAAAQEPRLNRGEAAASVVARTLGFAELMAAGAKARTFPEVRQDGAGAAVREAVTELWPRIIPEAVVDVLISCADMIVTRGVITGPNGYVSVLEGWDNCPVAADMLRITAEWAVNGRPAPAGGSFTPPHALASSMAFDRDDDALVLHGTWVLLALAHQPGTDGSADAADVEREYTCVECGGELAGRGIYGCECWNPAGCDMCGAQESATCGCWT